MKLLIIGGQGMAGHMMVQYFKQQGHHTVFYTSRNKKDPNGLILDVNDIHSVDLLVKAVHPDVIINAVGILNQYAEKNIIQAYHVNGFLPHRLANLADQIGAKLIHISTDCVFKGDRLGGYTEENLPDGETIYAITKSLGEVCSPGHLTIRTSIIGPEVRKNGIGLMHWFFQQKGVVQGYAKARWNGVTTLMLAKVVDEYMTSKVSGLIHLAHPEPVSKYELLLLFKEIWDLKETVIVPNSTFVQDRTLAVTREDVNPLLPSYRDMLKELKEWIQQG
ncbi:NAD(P)-dependent oxidoreductase [Paenibacillus sp. J45TS6]|uniref:dTDP-4-dehydrorhamnose reductase family protein n=1 Tax=Paenibacillus sp. J45TS6 TaxID=2807196 RepID=UPI001B2C5AF6|nr:SDR family oxidoreductase [Paenibacillus sp. J45TS6]GIP44779.1 NAD(P)-dependent oxidoreductase [Paenibacillus sp. J45TS6]